MKMEKLALSRQLSPNLDPDLRPEASTMVRDGCIGLPQVATSHTTLPNAVMDYLPPGWATLKPKTATDLIRAAPLPSAVRGSGM